MVSFMNASGDVRPPEKGLNKWRPVVGADFQFEIGTAGMQANAMHALHASHGIVVAAPDRDRAVRIAADGDFHGHERGGAMMLRPVEFNASGNPGPGEADQGRLNDVLAIEEVVAGALIQANMDAAADGRQDHETKEFVLDVYRVPDVRMRGSFDVIDDRQWINTTAAALVDALLEEKRIGVGSRRHVGEHGDRCVPGPHGPLLRVGRGRQFQFG